MRNTLEGAQKPGLLVVAAGIGVAAWRGVSPLLLLAAAVVTGGVVGYLAR